MICCWTHHVKCPTLHCHVPPNQPISSISSFSSFNLFIVSSFLPPCPSFAWLLLIYLGCECLVRCVMYFSYLFCSGESSSGTAFSRMRNMLVLTVFLWDELKDVVCFSAVPCHSFIVCRLWHDVYGDELGCTRIVWLHVLFLCLWFLAC